VMVMVMVLVMVMIPKGLHLQRCAGNVGSSVPRLIRTIISSAEWAPNVFSRARRLLDLHAPELGGLLGFL